jgi:PAS domain-containing protein
MISFEWLEFETLSRDIADLDDQFSAAKATKNHGRMRALEPQLEATKERRAKALTAITRRAASAVAEPAPKSDKATLVAQAAIENAPTSVSNRSASELTDHVTENAASIGIQSFDSKGDIIVWDRMTPELLGQAKRELVCRRAAMLARHAEEFKILDLDQDQIEALDRAINAFAQKFNLLAAGGEVVKLGEAHNLRTG